MNDSFSRRDTRTVGRWWWTIDRISLSALIAIIAIGLLMSFSASPPVAERLHLEPFFFVKRHALMLIPTLGLFWVISLLSSVHIRRVAALFYLISIALLIYTLINGIEIKGARRWIHLWGFSIQASEFLKPSLAIITAWMLSEAHRDPTFPGILMSLIFLGIGLSLVLLQPDLGMTFVIACTWLIQIFIAGLPMIWLLALGGLSVGGLFGAYFTLPHVYKRINQFLTPGSPDDLYQITQSLQAFGHGGIVGRGPGEGIIKHRVPDAHADFVFSVAGEEFGLFMCLLIVVLYCIIVLRSLQRASNDSSLFVLVASAGLSAQIGLQSFINMASSLHLIPTKGMTMPFISYGGSSLIALGLGMGMLFALTRRRHGWIETF